MLILLWELLLVKYLWLRTLVSGQYTSQLYKLVV